MTNAEVAAAKAELDSILADRTEYIGIAFGCDLYEEFWKNGQITLRKFEAVGLPRPNILSLPAYGEGQFAWVDLSIAADKFVVGKGA